MILTTSLEQLSDKTPLFFAKYSLSYQIMQALKSKKVAEVFLYHHKEKKLWKHLFRLFPVVKAAGGLVKHDNGQFLLIYRNSKWDLPKGKIEKKETLVDAAIREVVEETGVSNLKITKALPTTYHIFNGNGVYKLKKTSWFYMKTDFKGELKPQVEEQIKKVAWKTRAEISKLMVDAYKNIKLLFDDVSFQENKGSSI